MKKILNACVVLSVAMACSLFAGAGSATKAPGSITLTWDYPTNSITPDLSFNIYSSTSLLDPMTNWSVLTNLSASSVIATNAIQHVQFVIVPGSRYFTATASNFWGESDFSNVISTPPLPRSDMTLSIQRGN